MIPTELLWCASTEDNGNKIMSSVEEYSGTESVEMTSLVVEKDNVDSLSVSRKLND